MNKHILFITNSYPLPEYRRLWKKAQALSLEGHQVSIISPYKIIAQKQPSDNEKISQLTEVKKTTQSNSKITKNPKIIKGIKIYSYKKKPPKDSLISTLFSDIKDLIKISFLAWKIFLKNKFQIIHIFNPSNFPGLIGIFYKILGVIFVFEKNEDLTLRIKNFPTKLNFMKKNLLKFNRFIERIILKKASLVIVPDCTQKNEATKIIPQQKNKIITIEPLPDLKDFYQPFLNKDYKRGFDYMVIYSGSLRLERGIMNLLKTISFIINELKRTDILFILAGDGKDKNKIKEYIKKEKISNNVYLPGWLSHQHLLAYLISSDLGIVIEPQKNSNCSLRESVFEFMAVGKPVLSFNAIIGKSRVGEAGSFIEGINEMILAKEIIKLIDDKQKSINMGKIGRIRVEKKFNWLKSEIKLISAYNRIIEKKA
jgi:glycosyltransferase involved in cell wall biosynthesis